MPPSSWLTLVPPAVVIVTIIFIRQIHISLAIGILSAALVATGGLPLDTVTLVGTSLWRTITNIDNLYLYGFLLCIGFLVSLFTITGFSQSFAYAIAKKIHSARGAKYATMLISSLMLIDDYLAILTTGYIMAPLIDQFRISREKFAFLVHSFAGPIVILIPISSWVATIMAYMVQAGVETNPPANIPIRIAADPFFIYLQSIPYMLYSFLVVVSVLFIVQFHISFGPMHITEQAASTKKPPVPPASTKTSLFNLIAPLIVLIGGIALGLPFAGGYYLFGGQYSFTDAIKYNAHPFLVMLLSVLAAITVTVIIAFYKRTLSHTQIIPVLHDGFRLMFGAIAVVFLAATLSGLLANYVGTGQYIAYLLMDKVHFSLFPVMLFLVSLICAIATGSAWSNFALLLPIAIPMLTTLSGLPAPIDPHDLPLLLPALGALFSGSVCGDQISPLSDTTLMTINSTHTTIHGHTYTQIFYALPLIISCIIGYTIMGVMIGKINPWLNAGISFSISCAICLITLWLLNHRQKK